MDIIILSYEIIKKLQEHIIITISVIVTNLVQVLKVILKSISVILDHIIKTLYAYLRLKCLNQVYSPPLEFCIQLDGFL